jgi:hypothetical protein
MLLLMGIEKGLLVGLLLLLESLLVFTFDLQDQCSLNLKGFLKMLLGLFFIFLGLYIFSFSSFHSLIFLLFVEVLVLSSIFFLLLNFYSWFILLIFLLIAVCLGAYGVSLLVSNSRRKGFIYFLSF